MFNKRKLIKTVAIFFSLQIIFDAVYPTLTYALTSGPTAPEATSFEPVDTTDMVNLLTGDLSYTLPLLNVPGPAGSYPVALSYHAGINPNEDATWVGLGWNINPGSLVRSVNGYPDDWKNVQQYQSEGWVGGTKDRITAGLNVPIFYLPISVTGGIIYTEDTYKGSGIGSYYGLSYGYDVGGDIGLSAGYQVTNDPIGGTYVTLNGGVNYGEKLSGSLSISSTFKSSGEHLSSGIGIGVSQGYVNMLGASISSNGQAGISALGANIGLGSNFHKSGNIQSNTSSKLSGAVDTFFDMDPLLTFKNERTTYKIDEHQNDFVNGAMYNFPSSNDVIDTEFFNNHSFDVYHLFEISDEDNPPEGIEQPLFDIGYSAMMGGTLPAYDGYMVLGQGTGGAIKPYNFLNKYYIQNQLNVDDQIKKAQYLNEGESFSTTEKLEFMIENELSNRFLYDVGGDNFFEYNNISALLNYDFDDNLILSEPGKFCSYDNNKIGRATNIEWFTNTQIKNNELSNLVLPQSYGFERITTGSQANQIGAFTVTNPSGVTYHYALPAYSYDELQYTENKNRDHGVFHTEVKKNDKYAYSWYLTAITGPDYVDRGEVGLSSEDWGYWIEFEYGLWSPDYKWRNPAIGFDDNLDENFRSFSRGKKELYYLNAIRSASHTALFIKDMRHDAKGMTLNDRDNASFLGSPCQAYPTSTLKLSEIVLIKNEFLPEISYNTYNSANGAYCSLYPEVRAKHLGSNVLMTENLTASQRSILTEKAIKTIVLNTDYSLVPKTPNSFSNTWVYQSDPPQNPTLEGKLTLKSIEFLSKNRTGLLPPIQFKYKNGDTEFCADCFDFWGTYKNDYDSEKANINVRKMPTETSSQAADTWSLSEIRTSTGATISLEYESDDFSDVIDFNKMNFEISDLRSNDPNVFQVYLNEISGEIDNYLQVGQEVDLFAVITQAESKHYSYDREPNIGGCKDVDYFKLKSIDDYYDKFQITAIEIDHIVVEKIGLRDFVDFDLPQAVIRNNGKPTGKTEAYNCTDPPNAAGIWCVLKTAGSYTEYYTDFIGGEVLASVSGINQLGGGIRVKQIKTSNLGETHITEYDYNKPGTNISSGVTSNIPYKMGRLKLKYPEEYRNTVESYFNSNGACSGTFGGWLLSFLTEDLFSQWSKYHLETIGNLFFNDNPTDEDMDEFLSTIEGADEDFIHFRRSQLYGNKLARESQAPSAGVTYQYVTISNKVENNGVIENGENYSIHENLVYNKSMLDIRTSAPKTRTNLPLDNDLIPMEDANGFKVRDIVTRGVSIEDMTSMIGLPRASEIYDINGQLLSAKRYNYLIDKVSDDNHIGIEYLNEMESFLYQGIVDEKYINSRLIPYAKVVKNGVNPYSYSIVDEDGTNIISSNDPLLFEQSNYHLYDLVGVDTRKRTFPGLLLSVESRDNKTGITTTTKNLEFDFFSGTVTKTLTKDSYDNYFITETIPAYKKYPGMGLAINGGANMLTQQALSKVYKVDNETDQNPSGLVSASVQTWSDQVKVLSTIPSLQEGIWRKDRSYSYIGNDYDLSLTEDGLYPYSNFISQDFDAWNEGEEPSDQWQKNSEITLYDPWSHALEAMDVNENYAATKMDNKQGKVFATVANARYNEFAYSGAEEDLINQEFGGDVKNLGGNISTVKAHTGVKSIKTTSSTQSPFNFIAKDPKDGRIYRASIWSTSPTVNFQYLMAGGTVQAIESNSDKQAGEWYLHNVNFTYQGDQDFEVDFSSLGPTTVYWDDFRFHPIDAAMTSYVYNEWDELEYILDANNIFTKYEYDKMGRLKRTWREVFNHDMDGTDDGKVKISEDTIHYAESLNETLD